MNKTGKPSHIDQPHPIFDCTQLAWLSGRACHVSDHENAVHAHETNILAVVYSNDKVTGSTPVASNLVPYGHIFLLIFPAWKIVEDTKNLFLCGMKLELGRFCVP